MHNKILVTTPNLSEIGGVSSFLNTLLKAFEKDEEILFIPIQIGGNGKNLLGPIRDQYRVYRASKKEVAMGFINPSLLSKSFFRDGLFCKQFVSQNIPFVVFFHGWDKEFEKRVTQKYVNFFLNSFGKAQTIFVLSEAFKSKIIDWGYQGEVVVETTIIEDNFTKNFSIEEREQKLQNQAKFKILFLGRTEAEKGIFEIIEAFIKLLDRHKNIELLIAGEGKDFKTLDEITKGIKEIQLLGYVQGEEKTKLLKACDLYVLPSHSEGLPISVLEAMAFALSIVTTPVGGLKEFFQDEKMGYLVNKKDSNDLKRKLEIALSNPKKLLEQGRFNFNYAQKNLYGSMMAKRLTPYLKVNR
jgi:glycosyltransferase involved in cell wall biosynthesis